MPRRGRTDVDIRGAISINVAISRISPTRIPLLPGAIPKSTTAIPRVHQLVHFPVVPVRLGSRTWQEMSGNGVATFSRHTNRPRRQILTDRLMVRKGFIVAEVGSHASPVCGRPRGAQTCQTFRATISASGSFASASRRLRRVKLLKALQR